MMTEEQKEAITTLSRDIHAVTVAKGFWSKPVNMGEKLMLIVSELGEALEADRSQQWADTVGYELSETKGPEAYKKFIKGSVEEEFADTMIRLMDVAFALDMNLAYHIQEKLKYNKTRSKLHGKTY